MASSHASRPAALHSWLLAGAAGLAGAALTHGASALALPRDCAGLADAALVGLVRLFPATAAGWMLRISHDLAVVTAAALFWWLASALVPRRSLVTALTLAFTLTPAFVFTLGPTPLAAMAAALWLLVVVVREDRSSSFRKTLRGLAPLLLLAALAPPLTPAAAAASAAWVWLNAPQPPAGRLGLSALAVAAVVVSGALALSLAPGLPAPFGSQAPGLAQCLLPSWLGWTDGLGPATLRLGQSGAIVAGLALLGAFAGRAGAGVAPAVPVAVLALLCLPAAAPHPSFATEALAPMLVTLWLLAALGLGDLTRAALNRNTRPVAAAIVVIAIAALGLVERSRGRVAPDDVPLGHETLTRSAVERLVAVLPPDAGLVREDAVTDLLIRSVAGAWQRAGKDLTLVAPDPGAVRSAAESHDVYALPRAARALQHQGVRLGEGLGSGVTGSARVLSAVGCDAVDHRWRELPGLGASAAVAFAARDNAARGPVVLYLTGDSPLQPQPLGWPPNTVRGFAFERFDTTVADHRRRLDEELARDGGSPMPSGRYVLRLELWRTPDAPLVLPVGLGTTMDAAYGRWPWSTPSSRIEACPSFPAEVNPF